MTQRIFDIENEKDMADLWEILPDFITSVYHKKESVTSISNWVQRDDGVAYPLNFISLRWHDKTQITRPVDYEDMIGCVCKFSTCPIRIGGCFIGVLDNIDKDSPSKFHVKGGGWFEYCEPVKKSELKFWGE